MHFLAKVATIIKMITSWYFPAVLSYPSSSIISTILDATYMHLLHWIIWFIDIPLSSCHLFQYFRKDLGKSPGLQLSRGCGICLHTLHRSLKEICVNKSLSAVWVADEIGLTTLSWWLCPLVACYLTVHRGHPCSQLPGEHPLHMDYALQYLPGGSVHYNTDPGVSTTIQYWPCS